MEPILKMRGLLYSSLQSHLFPQDSAVEQVAFLFARQSSAADSYTFEAIEHVFVQSDGFEQQSDFHLELSDEMRASIIKHAHVLQASLIEIHSHSFPGPAQFSWFDMNGLREFVPHIWWRLKGCPYIALVFDPSSFDACVWLTNPVQPVELNALNMDGRVLRPTNLSIQRWEDNHDKSTS